MGYEVVLAALVTRHALLDRVQVSTMDHDQQEESNMIMIFLVRNRDNMIYNFSMVIPHFL